MFKGFACVSHRSKLSLGTFTLYEHDSAGGEDVDVYIVNTGINTKHAEFEGRTSWGKTRLSLRMTSTGTAMDMEPTALALSVRASTVLPRRST